MLLILLLISHIDCEWVEISQQTYRKPLRTTHNFPFLKVNKVTEDYFETTTRKINRIYINSSLQYSNWDGDFTRKAPNVGVVRRIFASTTEAPVYNVISEINSVQTTESASTIKSKTDKDSLLTGDTEENYSLIEDFTVPNSNYMNKEIFNPREEVANAIMELDKADADKNNKFNNYQKVTEDLHEHKNTEINAPVDENDSDSDSKEPRDNNANTMENIAKLMRVVANTISRNTRRNINTKTRYLQDLKDTILRNIENRIEAEWPDDDAHRRSRRSEAPRSTSRGTHIEFPSSESALMSISFLTFAVFLIKLVLQLIHTYKNKAMMVTPVIAAVGRTATTVQKYPSTN